MMKVEENLVVLPSNSVKLQTRKQAHYLPKKPESPAKHQLRIDDYLHLKKKKRSNENELIGTCPKKAKMMLNPFNKFNSYYLFNTTSNHSIEHCSSIHSTKFHHSAKITNQNNQSNFQNIQNNKNNSNKINSINQINLNGHQVNHSNHLTKIANHLEPTNHASLLFNKKTGLPLSSSPIPQHKSTFSFERSIKSSSNAIKRAFLNNKESETDENFNLVVKKPVKVPLFKNLLGNFEENLLNGRFNSVQTIHGKFRAEIGTYGKLYNNFFCPDHLKMPVTVHFYNIHEMGNVYASPYLAKVNLEKRGYLVPRKGNVQVTLFNPEDNIVKMFVVQYDLSDMPSNSQSFIRQKTYYMPKKSINSNSIDGSKLAAGSNRPNQINCQSTIDESTEFNFLNYKQTSKQNGCTSRNHSDENLSANIQSIPQTSSTANQTTNLPSNLTVSLSTTDLTSNLPTNLTIRSKSYSVNSTSVDDKKLCNFDFKTSWLRYLIHLRFISTKSGKIYLHRDIRILILRKNEFDPGNLIGMEPTFHWVTKQITEQTKK